VVTDWHPIRGDLSCHKSRQPQFWTPHRAPFSNPPVTLATWLNSPRPLLTTVYKSSMDRVIKSFIWPNDHRYLGAWGSALLWHLIEDLSRTLRSPGAGHPRHLWLAGANEIINSKKSNEFNKWHKRTIDKFIYK